MSTRVVVTGLGVIAPNANGQGGFELALSCDFRVIATDAIKRR